MVIIDAEIESKKDLIIPKFVDSEYPLSKSLLLIIGSITGVCLFEVCDATLVLRHILQSNSKAYLFYKQTV